MKKRLLKNFFIIFIFSGITCFILLFIAMIICKMITDIEEIPTSLLLVTYIMHTVVMCCYYFLSIEMEYFNLIKKNLSKEYKIVYLRESVNIPEITSLVIDSKRSGKTATLKAKIDEKDEVNLIVENVDGIIYEAKTTSYRWFMKNFYI